MNTLRFGTLIRRTASHFLHLSEFNSKSFPPPIPTSRLFSNDPDRRSPVYQHARLCKKPISTKFKTNLVNSISLIGFIDKPIRKIDTVDPDSFGVSTLLRVKNPRDPNQSFRIPLRIWDVMARRCNAHLKRNDFVSVSGRLVFPSNSSYHYQVHASSCQISISNHVMAPLVFPYMCCQVNVMEVNYVKVPTSDSQNTKLETEEDDKEESKKDEYCLWREYIENPSEWWDNRKNKKNPKQPDFKRKDTGEVLWIDSKKPIWVSKELELLDQIEETGIEKSSNDVIYLWQVFFANPSEWWDRRTTKKNPKQPDFKHKDTDEALWIDSDVPVWVIRQLELFDQRKANKEETRFDKFSDWL